jgi:NADH:ubiquinone oxidoreductase subunit E
MTDAKTCCACSQTPLNDEQMLAQIEPILQEYRDKPGGLIPALQIAQTLFGYLPKPVLQRFSAVFEKSYSEVAGVVTFYSFFSTAPRGKHLIRVCLGTACYVRGGGQVLDALKKRLGIDVGQTTPDGLFTLEVARCFGACGLAPTLSIDDIVYKRVRPTRIAEILDAFHAAGATAGKEQAHA